MRNLKVFCTLFTISLLKHFTEAAHFDGCDYAYQLNHGYAILKSPGYPYSYPPGTSCRYKYIAPLDHNIIVNCTVNLDKSGKGCSSEFFYLARDGDMYLRESESFCGIGTFIRKSLFRTVVLAYISGGSFGNFYCQLRVQPQPCDCGWSINTRIVNGQETTTNEFPSMVALKDRSTNRPFYCAAAIISHRYLLTAAHCTRVQANPSYIEAWVGLHKIDASTNTKYAAVYNISRIIEHPSYTAIPVKNDIAILVTERDIEYSRGVGPICLPPASNANNDFAYNYVDAIGWGSTRFAGPTSATLQKVTLMVTDYETCVRAFENVDTIYRTQICTYDYSGSSKDSCQFDSGGPVIYRSNRQFLVGIISFGKGCGVQKFSTGVNTRVTSYLQWIHQNTLHSACNVKLLGA